MGKFKMIDIESENLSRKFQQRLRDYMDGEHENLRDLYDLPAIQKTVKFWQPDEEKLPDEDTGCKEDE